MFGNVHSPKQRSFDSFCYAKLWFPTGLSRNAFSFSCGVHMMVQKHSCLPPKNAIGLSKQKIDKPSMTHRWYHYHLQKPIRCTRGGLTDASHLQLVFMCEFKTCIHLCLQSYGAIFWLLRSIYFVGMIDNYVESKIIAICKQQSMTITSWSNSYIVVIQVIIYTYSILLLGATIVLS